MKKLVFITILCMFLATPSLADYYVGVDNMSQTGGIYSFGGGGEFTISSSDLSVWLYTGQTSGILGGATSFQTFCVEVAEPVYSPVDVVVSTSGPTGSQAVLGGEAISDPLDARTAYLYAKFATQTLSTYDYLNVGVGRSVSARELQEAIWVIENENVGPATGQALAWITEAESEINKGNWSGIGRVRVLNLYVANTYGTTNEFLRQDQLYLVPVPGAVLLAILGLSVAGIKLRRFA